MCILDTKGMLRHRSDFLFSLNDTNKCAFKNIALAEIS